MNRSRCASRYRPSRAVVARWPSPPSPSTFSVTGGSSGIPHAMARDGSIRMKQPGRPSWPSPRHQSARWRPRPHLDPPSPTWPGPTCLSWVYYAECPSSDSTPCVHSQRRCRLLRLRGANRTVPFRPRGFSPPRRFAPHWSARVYCNPMPNRVRCVYSPHPPSPIPPEGGPPPEGDIVRTR